MVSQGRLLLAVLPVLILLCNAASTEVEQLSMEAGVDPEKESLDKYAQQEAKRSLEKAQRKELGNQVNKGFEEVFGRRHSSKMIDAEKYGKASKAIEYFKELKGMYQKFHKKKLKVMPHRAPFLPQRMKSKHLSHFLRNMKKLEVAFMGHKAYGKLPDPKPKSLDKQLSSTEKWYKLCRKGIPVPVKGKKPKKKVPTKRKKIQVKASKSKKIRQAKMKAHLQRNPPQKLKSLEQKPILKPPKKKVVPVGWTVDDLDDLIELDEDSTTPSAVLAAKTTTGSNTIKQGKKSVSKTAGTIEMAEKAHNMAKGLHLSLEPVKIPAEQSAKLNKVKSDQEQKQKKAQAAAKESDAKKAEQDKKQQAAAKEAAAKDSQRRKSQAAEANTKSAAKEAHQKRAEKAEESRSKKAADRADERRVKDRQRDVVRVEENKPRKPVRKPVRKPMPKPKKAPPKALIEEKRRKAAAMKKGEAAKAKAEAARKKAKAKADKLRAKAEKIKKAEKKASSAVEKSTKKKKGFKDCAQKDIACMKTRTKELQAKADEERHSAYHLQRAAALSPGGVHN
jgi:hypothetical protein